MRKFYLLITCLLLVIAPIAGQIPTAEAVTVRPIIFPVIGHVGYSNSYYEPRPEGRVHNAIDIFGAKMLQLVAAVDGEVTFAPFPEPSYGWMISIRDDDGYKYNYIHMNNDTPGTDNGRGGAMNAYTFDMVSGSRVVKGQLLGWLGDSGNAESTSPHLHFEMETPQGKKANPFYSLSQAKRLTKPVLQATQPDEILPFGKTTKGISISVDVGNFDSDAEAEIITASAHPFSGPEIRVYNHNNTDTGIRIFNPFPGYVGELDVAAGDIDGDGLDEIITAAGKGAQPVVKVFNRDGTQITEFYAYNKVYRYGVRVSAGDIDNDGDDEIITGPGAGLTPVVRVFDGDRTMIRSFYAYSDKEIRVGLDVASADVDNDGVDDIITGTGPGRAGEVRVFDSNTVLRQIFSPYGSSMKSGVRVSAGNVRLSSPEAEIAVAVQEGSPSIGLFEQDGTKIDGRYFFERWWRGFNDIGAGEDLSFASSGINRRATIRQAFD